MQNFAFSRKDSKISIVCTVPALVAAFVLCAMTGQAQMAAGRYQPSDLPMRGGMGMAEGFARPITGAPYSATITHTRSQSLADGVTISHSESETVTRDSQGRIRVETTITPKSRPGETAAEKAMRPESGPRKMVVVYDPVAGTITRWSDSSKTAVVMPMHRLGERGGMHGGMGRPGMQGRERMGPRGEMGPRGGMDRGQGMRGEVAKSDLGSKTVAGVSALGERETHTIAAGVIGNDKPIVSTHERWVSPDLKIVLSETNNDPIRGKNTLLVANLSRAEPAAALFKAPADYTVHEMRAPQRGAGGPGGGQGPAGQGPGGRGPGGRGLGGQGRPNGWQGRNRPAPPEQPGAETPSAQPTVQNE